MNLESEVQEAIIELAKEHSYIQKVMLFGSRARGDHHKTSDIDLAIWAEGSISEFTYALDEQVPTLLEFDVSDMSEIEDIYFIDQVLKEGIVLYEKPRF